MAEQLYGLTASDVAKLRSLIAATDSILRAAGKPAVGGPVSPPTVQPFCLAQAVSAVSQGSVGNFKLLTGDHRNRASGSNETVKAQAATRAVAASEVVQLALTASSKWYVLGGGGGGATIRLAQTSGLWPNEPPANAKAVQLFRPQTAEELGRTPQPWEWVPELDAYGDPVLAVAINWFTHIPVGQGDLIKWCAITPIGDLAGEYDTGQVTYEDGVETPIMRAYDKLWLLLAIEC